MNRKDDLHKTAFDPKKIKALAIDLDGTILLPDTTLGERTQSCIRKLISKGMQIIIATGRAVESSERFRSAMGTEGPMVFFNGAVVADVPSYKLLYENLISLEAAKFGADLARDMGVHYQLYLPAGILIEPLSGKDNLQQKWETLLVEKKGPESEMYFRHTGILPIEKDLKIISEIPDLKGCIKGMFIADPSLHDEIRRRMHDRFGDQINLTRSFPTFLEVLNAGVSKGEGLKIAMRHRGLNPEEVIAFGDEENDLSMFEAAGYCAAPSSAREKIREAADFIYGPITEEGLAIYLEEAFL